MKANTDKLVIGTVNVMGDTTTPTAAHGKPIGFDLETLVRTRLLIQADSGGGKSWLIRVLLEQAFGKIQTIVIDPEGEFSTLREQFPFVLVGKGGETPADPRSAELVAHRLLELNASAICDLYELKTSTRHEWVRIFVQALVDAPKDLWHQVLVIVDEAHLFCPEKGESQAAGAMIDLATRGRKRGFCAVWATQRLAKLDKDASSELQNRLIGPTFEDVNRKRAAEVLGILKPDEREFFRQIQLLEPGNFFALGRAISTERVLVKIRGVQTSHPEIGSAKHAAAPPPAPEKIRALLPKLADLPKEAEEKARTEADFRREISQLKRELTLAKQSQPAPAAPDPRKIQAQIDQATKPLHVELEKCRRAALQTIDNLVKAAAPLNAIANLKLLQDLKDPAPAPGAVLPQASERRPDPPSVKKSLHPTPAPAAPVNGLQRTHAKVLNTLAGVIDFTRGERIPKLQLAAWTGYSASGGGFNNILGSLRTAGLITGSDPIELTAAGRAHAQPDPPPISNQEVLERVSRNLTTAEQKILAIIHQHYPAEIDKQRLADIAGYAADGGGFNNYLGHLRTLGLIEGKGAVKCCEYLFVE